MILGVHESQGGIRCWKGTGPGDKKPMLKFKNALLKIGSVTLGNLLSYEEAAGQAKPWAQLGCHFSVLEMHVRILTCQAHSCKMFLTHPGHFISTPEPLLWCKPKLLVVAGSRGCWKGF